MGNFDWKIWRNKIIKKVLFGAVFGGLTELSAALGTEPVPTQYVWVTVVVVELIEIILNALKHKLKK